MNKKTDIVRARMDPALKRQVEVILKRLGLTHSALINMTYRALVQEGGIPFSTRVPNAETARELARLRDPAYRASLPSFDDVDALMADLHDDD